jgi:chromosomal replication initiation ATPase DnaA
MDQSAVQDTYAVTQFQPFTHFTTPQPDDDILHSLIDALRATVAHPDASFQALAAATLNQVHEIQEAARRKLAAQRREITGKRLKILIDQIAVALRIDADRLRSHARQQHVAFKRQIAMFVVRRLTSASYPVVAAAFNRDHSTCIHACNLIERRLVDPAFKLFITKLEAEVTQVSAAAHSPGQTGAGAMLAPLAAAVAA